MNVFNSCTAKKQY